MMADGVSPHRFLAEYTYRDLRLLHVLTSARAAERERL